VSTATSSMTSHRSALDVRGDFPYAGECVYLNTAGAGLSWRGQGAAAASFYDGPKSRGLNGMADWRAEADEARARLARLFDVSTAEIRFAASTTEGLYLSLGAVPFKDGDEIVVAADEFPSVLAACANAPRAAVAVNEVAVPDESSRETALLDAITTKTRAVALSHVHWVTGTRINLDRVATACRAVGATLVVDGAQALGAVPVVLGDTALYSASVFKWLVSGFGLAVLIVREGASRVLEPLVRGYNNPAPSRELQYSHVNYPGIHALSASLAYLEQLGWDRIYAQVDALWLELHASLTALNIDVVTPATAHAGIISCKVPDASGIKNALAGENVYVEERAGLLRVSPHFYNTSDDIAAFIERLDRLRQRPTSYRSNHA
jgi:cysteine desulfurase/selenocysteine lyase